MANRMQAESKHPKLMLVLLNLASLFRVLLLFILPIWGLKRLGEKIIPAVQDGGFSYEVFLDPFLFIGIASWVFLYMIGEKLDHRMGDMRNERDFDENGLNRKYNEYQKLTPKEREQIDKQRLADVERLIGTGQLKKMTKNGSKDPDKALDKLLGMQNIKNKVREMNARMEFDARSERDVKHKKGKSSTAHISANHMAFIGNPGTGKTTVAKIMTGFLYKNDIIKYNKYIETDGNFLRGQTQGETSEKTSLLLSMAKGKVLFIDEAYALFSGPDAQEAIATVIKAMEDDRDSFVLILAGYRQEMKQLIDSNPGFFSRIGHVLHFEDYTDDELCDIFSTMANKHNFYVPLETRERVRKRLEREKKEKYFGNARTCRNILNEAISKHAMHVKNGTLDEAKTYTLCPEDIDLNAGNSMR